MTIGAPERKLLGQMPLHAITTVHGEPGLRERLAIETAAWPTADRARVQAALDLATRLHARDRRQREPYVNHLLRVSLRIISHYSVSDCDLACAALLHDAIEDHPDGLAPGGNRDDAVAVLASQFGPRVAELVDAVTNPEFRPDRDRHEQYREHVITSLEANPAARVIKASDMTDNAVGLIHTTGPRIAKLARKYGPLLPAVRDLILRPDTPLAPDVKDRIAAQFSAAMTRVAAISSGEEHTEPEHQWASPIHRRPA